MVTNEKIRILSILISWIIFIFQSFNSLIRSFNRKIETAGQGFIWLTKWGKRSGITKVYNETPSEYANRLQQRFGSLKNEIRTIISAFQLEIYGKVKLNHDKLQPVDSAVKTIYSPIFWWLRLKSIWKV